MPGTNTDTDTKWSQAVLRLTTRAPDVEGTRWATLTRRILGYHHSTASRHRHFSDSDARNTREMARGQPTMIRANTSADLYQLQRSKANQTTRDAKARRHSNATAPKSQFPPINGTAVPSASAKPEDENLHRSREDVTGFLPQTLRHVGSSNSLASNGSGPVKTDFSSTFLSKRHSSPAIIPAAERRVSFDVGASGKSSGDGGESMLSGHTKSSGPNSNSPPTKMDRLLRPISVMTNYSSPLSSVIEQTFHIEEVPSELHVDQVRPQTVAVDTHKVSKVKNNATKYQQSVLYDSKLARKKPAIIKPTLRTSSNNRWRAPVDHRDARLDYNRNERRPSKCSKPPPNKSSHFESVSDYDQPPNIHRTVTFVYDEKEGKSEMVVDTPRSIDFLNSSFRLESWGKHEDDIDEEVVAGDGGLCAPLTEKNLQSREEDDEIPDKNRQILNWVLCGYLEPNEEEPTE